MKSIFIIGIWMLIFLSSLVLIPKGTNFLIRMIFIWLTLNSIICIYELIVLMNRKQICNNQQLNFWKKEYKFKESLGSKFWIDGWSEYSKFDPRYCNSSNYIYLVEFGNIIFTFIPFVIMIGYLLSNHFDIHKIPKWAFKLLLISSCIQLTLTSIYLTSGIKTYNSKYNSYLIFNLPWIIMPIVTIYWSYKIITI